MMYIIFKIYSNSPLHAECGDDPSGNFLSSFRFGDEIICCPVRFQSLTSASMKMTILWDVAPCNLVEVYDVSEVIFASIIRVMCTLIALMMEGTSTSSERVAGLRV
jgi:hypothetical protein